tara:strand:- start:403 stop:1551 length:1149 start_codon:yes stop_codon:yes gene_type:complete
MALSKIDVANMLTGATPVANGGTALTSGFVNGRANDQGAPIIINGDMAVAQRSTSTVAQADDSNEGYATVDRFAIKFSNSAGGTITTSRDTTTPTGFGQSIKLNVTSADTSVGSTHIVDLRQVIEAQVIRNSGWNYTSSSSYLTLSFQIRSSKTGTYCVYFQTNDGTAYMYTAEYTISSADTWEQKVITVPGNSNLTFNNDNGVGLRVAWVLAVGTDRDGTAGSWTSGNAFGTSNQVNFLDSTDNIAYITGVQLEVGQFTSSTLPPFQHESFGDNLARCQRYFQAFHPRGSGKAFGSTTAYLQVPLLKPMRSTPSYSQNAVFRITNNDTGEFTQSSAGGSFDQSDNHSGRLSGTNFSSLTDAQTIHAAPNGNVSAHFDSEME